MTEEMSEYELLRQRNIEENLKKMRELGIGLGLFKESSKLNEPKTKPSKLNEPKTKSSTPKLETDIKPNRPRRYSDQTIMYAEKRRSKRLSARQVVTFTEEVSRLILGDEDSCSVSWADDSDYGIFESDDEDTRKPQKRRPSGQPRQRHMYIERDIPSVEEITEKHLKNIAECVRDKVYSQDGTTCHQCRQKTLDQKTYCRSSECVGVRGQFCGPCLKNRYGEYVAEALKDPEWTCPPCKGICNCSICRSQLGKLPTGQLYYFAQKKGYDSVKQFLEEEDDDD